MHVEFLLAVLFVLTGCSNHPAFLGGAGLPFDGSLTMGMHLAYERGLPLPAEDIHLPMRFSVEVAVPENGGETVTWVGASVVWQYLWDHGFGPARPGQWRVRIDLLTGSGLVLSPDGNTSAWELGARLRFKRTDGVCLDLAHRWVPVKISVAGHDISDLGGLQVSVGREW